MAPKTQLDPSFWNDPDFAGLGPKGIVAYWNICSHNENNSLGINYVRKEKLVMECQMTVEEWDEAMELLQDRGKVKVEGNWVWVVGRFKHAFTKAPDWMRSLNILKDWYEAMMKGFPFREEFSLKYCHLLGDCFRRYCRAYRMEGKKPLKFDYSLNSPQLPFEEFIQETFKTSCKSSSRVLTRVLEELLQEDSITISISILKGDGEFEGKGNLPDPSIADGDPGYKYVLANWNTLPLQKKWYDNLKEMFEEIDLRPAMELCVKQAVKEKIKFNDPKHVYNWVKIIVQKRAKDLIQGSGGITRTDEERAKEMA